MMRVVFMGTPEFAVRSLDAVLEAGHEVPLVVTAPDRPKGRGLKTAPSDVRRYAEQRGLPVSTPESLKDPRFIESLREARADVICVVAFRILPEVVFSIPPKGSFNLHASLLPRYRGAAPINWAIINGERETGVTTFFLQRSVDTGAIVLQKAVPIGEDMTAGELHDVLKNVGATAVVETLRMIEQGNVATLRQDDSLATPAPKIFREDCRIDWTLPPRSLHDFIRGLSPYPGAFCFRSDSMVKIIRARPAERQLAPGELGQDGGRLLVGAGAHRAGGALEILEIQPEGRRSMNAAEYLRGHPLQAGEELT